MVGTNPIHVSLSVAAGKVCAVAKGQPSEEESRMCELLEAKKMSRTKRDTRDGVQRDLYEALMVATRQCF